MNQHNLCTVDTLGFLENEFDSSNVSSPAHRDEDWLKIPNGNCSSFHSTQWSLRLFHNTQLARSSAFLAAAGSYGPSSHAFESRDASSESAAGAQGPAPHRATETRLTRNNLQIPGSLYKPISSPEPICAFTPRCSRPNARHPTRKSHCSQTKITAALVKKPNGNCSFFQNN